MDSIYHGPLDDWLGIMGGQSLRLRIVPGLGSSWPIIKYTFLEVMRIFGWRGRVFVGSFLVLQKAKFKGVYEMLVGG
jgi:hypothetical protein